MGHILANGWLFTASTSTLPGSRIVVCSYYSYSFLTARILFDGEKHHMLILHQLLRSEASAATDTRSVHFRVCSRPIQQTSTRKACLPSTWCYIGDTP